MSAITVMDNFVEFLTLLQILLELSREDLELEGKYVR